MADVAASDRGRPVYRYVLTRETRGANHAATYTADVTGRVVSVGVLEERCEEAPGVGSFPSLALECIPDETLAADGPLLGNRDADAEVELKVVARYRAGDEEIIFAGVLADEPEYRDAVDASAVTLRFVGRLAAMWGDQPIKLEVNGAEVAWGYVGDALVPALLAASPMPPARVDISAPGLTAAEPFWSYFGDPAAAAEIQGVGSSDVKGLAWDAGRKVLYVGVGRFVCSFEPARRRWETVASVRYGDYKQEPKNETWRVAHLEYDAAGDRVLGVAESAASDVTRRATHLKAIFVIDL